MTPITEYLQYLHAQAGRPSVRRLAAGSRLSRTTIADTLRGKHRARWTTAVDLAVLLGGTEREAKEHWLASQDASEPAPPRLTTGDVVDRLDRVIELLERLVEHDR